MRKCSKHTRISDSKYINLWPFLDAVHAISFISVTNIKMLSNRFGVSPDLLAFLVTMYGGEVEAYD